MSEAVRYRNDKRLRDMLFAAESYAHPAKGHLGMWEDIIQRYTQPGDTVLDPMSGVGSTLLAALMGRDVVTVELEEHFWRMQLTNWEKMRQHPMLGYSLGTVRILRGDARNLSGLVADCIVTSPPYGDTETSGGGIALEARSQRNLFHGYTQPHAIITSSPFQERKAYEMEPDRPGSHIQQGGWNTLPRAVSDNPTNIGNERGQKYWDSMEAVYRECFCVLRPGGIMALVVKGFTREGKYVDLPSQTADLCASLGFVQFDHWRRELWSLSFWRILQQRRDPKAFDERLKYEEVLAFRKPPGAGQGVDAVVTSPPFQSTTAEQDTWKDAHAAEMAVGFRERHPGYKAPPGNKRPSHTVSAGRSYTRPKE